MQHLTKDIVTTKITKAMKGFDFFSHVPPAEPEAFRLLAPQSGRLANGLNSHRTNNELVYPIRRAAMKNFQQSKTSVVSCHDLEVHDSRKCQTLGVPSRAGGLLTIKLLCYNSPSFHP